MLSDIVIGRYFPSNSLIHKLDPRVKVIICLILIIFIFLTLNYISLSIITIAIFIMIIISKIKFKLYLKSLKPILVIIAFTAVLNLFYGQGEPIVQLWFIKITRAGINDSVFMSIRLINLVIVSSLLTFTTSPTDLTDAFERLMKPLKFFGVRVGEIALMMTISLRFIPILLEETDRIIAAQKSRGVDFETGGLIKRIRALVPILIPLFISSFKRAYELSVAMECRCYHSSDGKTKMRVLKIRRIDIISILIIILLCLGVSVCNLIFPHTIK